MLKNAQNKLSSSLKFPIIFLLIIWTVHLIQVITGIDFGYLGVYPRSTFGLKGILLSPIIHADWHHLFSNSVPIAALSFLIFFFYKRVAVRAIFMIYLLTGLAVWLFARQVFHIGASGLVYGFVSFVFWSGIFRRNLKSIVLALIVTFLYSGYFYGILPNQEGISWESHLLGGLVGIFAAYWYKSEIETDEERKRPSWELEDAPLDDPFFLRPDAFEKTKSERLRDLEQRQSNDWTSNNSWE